jgi:uncharacterized repeat protein (TIGR01451 family)
MVRLLHRAAAAACAAICLQASIAFAQTTARADSPDKERVVKQLEQQPLSFEENHGQADAGVKFLARSRGYTFFLTDAGAIVARTAASGKPSALRLTFTGADPKAHIAAEDLLPGKIYYASRDTKGALSGRSAYRRVRQRDLYPGIDLLYYANQRNLEFDFIVEPHKDPNQIRLAFSGAEKVTLEATGELSFRLDGEDVRLKKPVIYQERDGTRKEIAGGYRIIDTKSHVVGFRLGDYDESRPLVIDPTIVFATYRGGSAFDGPHRLTVNALGEVYLFATSGDPSTLPQNHYTQRVPLATPQQGFAECFLTKIGRDGRTAQYTVIFEGAGCQAMDVAEGVGSADTKIHLHVGTSFHYQRTITESPTGELTIAPLQGGYDACQLGSCGPVHWMRADAGGNVYFIIQYAHTAGSSEPVYELRKIDSQGQLVGAIELIRPPIYVENGTNYIWDQITGFDIDDRGNAYVVGIGATPGLITPTSNGLQTQRPSGDVCTDPNREPCFDGFVIKVDTVSEATFRIKYASYLGGSHDDRPFAVAWDRASNAVYVTGTTRSPNFPVTAGAFSTIPPLAQGLAPSFLVKLDLNGAPPAQQLVFGTFLGVSNVSASALAVLPGGLAAVGSMVWEAPCSGVICFPLVNSLYPRRFQNNPYPALSVFSADGGSLLFSTMLDKTVDAESWLSTLATNGSPVIYVGMSTNDATLATAGALQASPTGEHDALVQAIDLADITSIGDPPTISFTPSTIDVTVATPATGAIVPLVCGRLFTCTLDDPDGDSLTHLVWFGPNGYRRSNPGLLPAPANHPGIVPTDFVSLPVGTHTFTLMARDEQGNVGTATLTVNVRGENTFAGIAQRVVLTDPKFVTDEYKPRGPEHPIELTFANVTTSGLTWLDSRSDLTPAPPVGMQAGSPPYYYDVQSTATFTGPVNVCFNIRGMSFARGYDELRIHWLDQGVWRPLLGATTTADQVCGEADALGTFAILYQQVPETAIATIAGTGVAEDAIDGPGGDVRDDFAEHVPPTQSSLTRPGRMARDAAGRLYVEDNGSQFGTRIRRFDPNGTIETVVPEGVCNGLSLPLAADPNGQFLYCARWNQVTGRQDIIKYDFLTGMQTAVASAPEVLAMVFDDAGNLFFSDGAIYRVPAAGGNAQRIFQFDNRGGALTLPYYDRAWTLAFDREGHLLAGGFTLIRISPGADGLVDGSADEAVAKIAGIPGIDVPGYAEPFAGDGLPASQALLIFTYQMVVAEDGAVVFTDQGHGIRRIAPGADGVVNGGADEMVRTIAGYFYLTLGPPSDFATSEWGDFRGLLEDPNTPNSFIVSSHIGHKVQRFGIPQGTETEPTADVSVALTASGTSTIVGGTVTFTVTIANAGPSPATSVTTTVSVPTGMSLAVPPVPTGTNCTAATTSITCVTDALAPGQQIGLPIEATATAVGTSTAVATISAAEDDPQPANNQASVNVDIDPSADLSIVVSAPAEGASVHAGETFTFNVALTNHGPANTSTGRLNVTLPNGFHYVSATVQGGGACDTLAGLVCDFDNFTAGTTRTIQLVVRPLALGSLTTAFAVSAPLADPNPASNSVTRTVTSDLVVMETIRVTDAVTAAPAVIVAVAETIRVDDAVSASPAVMVNIAETIHVQDAVPAIPTTADVSIAVSAAPATLDAGTSLRYTLTVTNSGPATASDIVIIAPAEGGFTMGPVNAPGTTCRGNIIDGRWMLTCSLDTPLPSGGQYVMTVDITPTAAGTLTNTFSVLSRVPSDPVAANNEVSVGVTVNAATDLAIGVVPSRTLVNLNVPLTYAVTVTNNGPMTAPLAATTITLPSGFVIDQITLPGLACTTIFLSSTWTCGLGDIASGAAVQFSVIGRFTTGGGTLTATFGVGAGALHDPVPANNAASVAVTVNRPPVVDAGPDRVVLAATSPVGVQVSASVSDPDGDSVPSVVWYEGPTLLRQGALTELTLPFGVHTITVVATDSRGGQGSDTVTINVRPTFLPPPAWVSGDPNAPAQVAVSWAPVFGAAEYRVYRDVDPVATAIFLPPSTFMTALTGNARLVATVSGTSFVDTGLPPLVRQYYAVVAVNGGTVSEPRPSIEVLVQAQPNATIVGFADMHNHQFANLGFAGRVIHGDASGPIDSALESCEDTHGQGGLQDPVGSFLTQSIGHDTRGFNPASYAEYISWPSHNTRTHQQAHYEMVRRAFDGGQRLMVVHAESNKLLCEIATRDPLINCEDMTFVETQLNAAKALQTYVDNLSGGAGRGWYRIAYSGAEARHIINSGKMAVVLGIEVDDLFRCGKNATCTFDDVRQRLNYYHSQGVRHLFPVGHFDNGFGGAAMYNTVFSFGNWVTTGSFLTPRECGPEGYRYAPNLSVESAIYIALRVLLGQPPSLPAFPDPPFVADCNSRGLTGLGDFLIREMMAKGMIIDIDHMSALTANSVLTIAEQADYPGVVSGHSGPLMVSGGAKANEGAKSSSQLTRIYGLGGLAAVLPAQGDRGANGILQYDGSVVNDCGQSTKTFAQAYQAAVDLAGGPANAAVAIGTDFNGFGGQPGPRFGARPCPGDSSPGVQANPIQYPFNIFSPTGINAGKLSMSILPQREDNNGTIAPWDFNVDGLAHAGLVPDMIEDLRRVGVSDDYLRPLFRSAEAYVHMWEQADGSNPPFIVGTAVIPGLGLLYQATSMNGTEQPVTVAFTGINGEGRLVAEPMENPPAVPAGYLFIGTVFDLFTTATYTGPATVCIDGTFVATDRLVHFESDAWVDITVADQSTLTRICGRSTSFSPFAVVRSVNRAPSANAGEYAPIEATSPAGAAVSLSGSGSDPDEGDAVTFTWTEGSAVLGTDASITTTVALGTHDVTLTVTDSHGASATSTARVIVRDTTVPVVTAPAALAIPAVERDGTRVSAWPALKAWLESATSRDVADASPTALAATTNGAPVAATTLFPIGTTSVTFGFRDASGNTGVASSTVTVAVGTPRLETALVKSGTLSNGRRFVDLSVANIGSGIARRATMIVIPLTSKGFGFAIVRTPMPVTVGDLNPGQSRVVRVELTVPASVKELLLVQAGAFVDVRGQPGLFTGLVTYKP